mgnify:CR=1 FL=1
MKNIYKQFLLTGIFCSFVMTANAFDYTSKNTGFSITVPDQNIMVIGENIFAAENRIFDFDKQTVQTNGIHMVTCLTKSQLQNNFSENFTTEKFTADLQSIAEDLKNKKKPLDSSKYQYLRQAAIGAYINYSSENSNFSELAKLNKQLSNATEIKKINVENINGRQTLKIHSELKNIGLQLKLPWQQSEQEINTEQLAKDGIQLSIADDGHLMINLDKIYHVQATTYLLSANDNLYAVTNLYQSTDTIPGMENLYKLDKKGFSKLSKDFVQNLKITEAVDKNEHTASSIQDQITGRNINLPDNWLYTKTDFASMYSLNKKGVEFAAYNALPEATLQKANLALKTFGISYDENNNSLQLDLSNLGMADIMDFFDESVLMVSGNLNSMAQLSPELAISADEYKKFFDSPVLTKLIIASMLNQIKSSITPEQIATMEKYVKVNNFTYNFDLNYYNGYFDCEADLQTHLPDIFQLLRQQELKQINNPADNGQAHDKLFDSIINDNLVPFNCYVRNQLYFNRSRHFNNLLYLTKGDKTNADQQILRQFNLNDLYIY